MQIIETGFPGLLVLEPDVFNDDRGYFFESYQQKRYEAAGIPAAFIQDNESKSTKGVVRGLHFQKGEFAQAKLVRVVSGRVLDIAVDLRLGSPTFGKWYGVELSHENKKQFFLPRGFAHGFSVLSDVAVFCYKCDNYYNKESEGAINLFDPELDIDWQINKDDAIVSEKDKLAPLFSEAEIKFSYK